MISRISGFGAHGAAHSGKSSPVNGSSSGSQPVFDLASFLEELGAEDNTPQPKKTAAVLTQPLQMPSKAKPEAQASGGQPNEPAPAPKNILVPAAGHVRANLPQLKITNSQPSGREQNGSPGTNVPLVRESQVLPLAFSIPVLREPDMAKSTDPVPSKSPATSAAGPVDQPDQATVQPVLPTELAFSARIQPHTDAPAVVSKSAPNNPGIAVQSLSAEPASTSPDSNTASPVAHDYLTPELTAASTAPTPKSGHAVSNVVGVELKEPVAAPAQPIREVVLRLPGSQSVEVKVTEKLGELKVDVRSGDQALTHELRSNLRDLVSGLDRKGFTAEITQTDGSTTGAALQSSDTGSFKDSQKSADHDRAFDQQQQEKQQQEHDEQRDGRSSRSRTEQWAAAFDARSK